MISVVPTGLDGCYSYIPGDESPGYSQPSLRDENGLSGEIASVCRVFAGPTFRSAHFELGVRARS